MILQTLAEWLSALPPLARQMPQGVAVDMAAAAPGCALCSDGEAARQTDISGRRTETRRYVLYLRAVCLREAERAALARLCEQVMRAVEAADAARALPVLDAPYTAQALRCAGMRPQNADDSGLSVCALTLLFTVSSGPDSLCAAADL